MKSSISTCARTTTPSWSTSPCGLSPLSSSSSCFIPFFFVGYHAFYHGRNWVRIPGIAYGVHTATTLIPILAEILTDEDIPTDAARAQLFLIYLPYLIIPAMIAILLALEEKPFGKAGDAHVAKKSTRRSKTKRG